MNIVERSMNLMSALRKLRNDIALELTLTTNRPKNWLPRTVFVEEDEYEAGFVQYTVNEIHQDGNFTGVNKETGETVTMPLTEINIDWLMLLLDIYENECREQDMENKEIRRCDHCGKPMKKGYYLSGEYACSDECCLNLYHGNSKAMHDDLSKADTDDGECYHTEWESYYAE